MTANYDDPYVLGVLPSGDAFADRVDEVARLKRARTDSKSRLIYYGDQRQGKTSALAKAASEARGEGMNRVRGGDPRCNAVMPLD